MLGDNSGKESNIIVRAWKGTNFPGSNSARLIKTGDGVLGKIVINSHSSGTFKLFDGVTNAAAAIGGTYTPAAGSSVLSFEPLGFDTGLYMNVSGTLDATIYYL